MHGYLDLEFLPALITLGNSLSAPVALGAKHWCGIAMPAGWDAAALTFQVSADGGITWLDLHSSTAELSFTAAAGQFIAIDPAPLGGFTLIRVRSGTSASPVNQTAARNIGLAVRSVLP